MTGQKYLRLEKADKKKSAFSGFIPSFDIELKLLSSGYKIIAGIDEAGRGPLAGPLSLGIVIYDTSILLNPPETLIHNIRDSKKLTEKKRLYALEIIKNNALITKTIFVPHKIIDLININRATEFALHKALRSIQIKPDVIIMDGNFSFSTPGIPFIPVIKGDSRSITIASASICAKVDRDNIMNRFHQKYPEYGFDKNKGYGTRAHLQAIEQFGYSHIHRRSYEPVRSMLTGNNRFQCNED